MVIVQAWRHGAISDVIVPPLPFYLSNNGTFFFNNQDNNNHFFKCTRLVTRPVNVACVTSLRGKNAAAVARKLEKDAGLPPELVITHS